MGPAGTAAAAGTEIPKPHEKRAMNRPIKIRDRIFIFRDLLFIRYSFILVVSARPCQEDRRVYGPTGLRKK
jgi:hypothetical protein